MTPAGILFGRTYRLADGSPIRFRLAGPLDQPGVAALLDRLGYEAVEFELMRLLRGDPRTQAVVCATSLIDGRETVLGLAAAATAPIPAPGDRSLLLVDPRVDAELRPLLIDALGTRLHSSRRAA